jgi:hypothetical protein
MRVALRIASLLRWLEEAAEQARLYKAAFADNQFRVARGLIEQPMAGFAIETSVSYFVVASAMAIPASAAAGVASMPINSR